MSKTLTLKEAARFLKLSPQTIAPIWPQQTALAQ
jgi:hypothetical protein